VTSEYPELESDGFERAGSESLLLGFAHSDSACRFVRAHRKQSRLLHRPFTRAAGSVTFTTVLDPYAATPLRARRAFSKRSGSTGRDSPAKDNPSPCPMSAEPVAGYPYSKVRRRSGLIGLETDLPACVQACGLQSKGSEWNSSQLLSIVLSSRKRHGARIARE